jgi:hypothetical protein
LKPAGPDVFTAYYFVLDNFSNLTIYNFSDHSVVNSRNYGANLYATAKAYKSIYGTNFVLFYANFGQVVLINVDSSGLFYYNTRGTWLDDGYTQFDRSRNLVIASQTKLYGISNFLDAVSTFTQSEVIVHPYNRIPCG